MTKTTRYTLASAALCLSVFAASLTVFAPAEQQGGLEKAIAETRAANAALEAANAQSVGVITVADVMLIRARRELKNDPTKGIKLD